MYFGNSMLVYYITVRRVTPQQRLGAAAVQKGVGGGGGGLLWSVQPTHEAIYKVPLHLAAVTMLSDNFNFSYRF